MIYLKKVLLIILLLSIGVFFQLVFIGTSPKISENEINTHFFHSLKTIGVELCLLILILITLNKVVLKMNNENILATIIIFICIYCLTFVYFSYDYYKIKP
jgi:hypothetical protein